MVGLKAGHRFGFLENRGPQASLIEAKSWRWRASTKLNLTILSCETTWVAWHATCRGQDTLWVMFNNTKPWQNHWMRHSCISFSAEPVIFLYFLFFVLLHGQQARFQRFSIVRTSMPWCCPGPVCGECGARPVPPVRPPVPPGKDTLLGPTARRAGERGSRWGAATLTRQD